jgi:hypothetical protein
MLVLSAQSIALLVVCPILAYFLAKWLFQKDSEKEARRMAAARLAGVLSKYGLKRLPTLLLAYSVGDYSGMAKQIQAFADLLQTDEKHITSEFDDVFSNVLEMKLATPEGKALLVAKLAAMQAPATPATPAPLAVS